MRGDANPAYDGQTYPPKSGNNMRNYWIAGGLITLAAIGYGWWDAKNEASKSAAADAQAQLVRPTKKSAPVAQVDSSSSAGMKRAGLENTHTPQIGRASGEDGAPKSPSASENPDDLEPN